MELITIFPASLLFWNGILPYLMYYKYRYIYMYLNYTQDIVNET